MIFNIKRSTYSFQASRSILFLGFCPNAVASELKLGSFESKLSPWWYSHTTLDEEIFPLIKNSTFDKKIHERFQDLESDLPSYPREVRRNKKPTTVSWSLVLKTGIWGCSCFLDMIRGIRICPTRYFPHTWPLTPLRCKHDQGVIRYRVVV